MSPDLGFALGASPSYRGVVSVGRSPLEVLEAMVGMFVNGDVSEIAHVVADDYQDHQGLGGSPVSGPAGFTSVVGAARSGYRELNVAIVQAQQTDDRVIATIRWRGIRPDGGSVERETEDEIRVVNGRAVEHWGRRL